MMNSWEKAVSTIRPNIPNDEFSAEIKAKQREIQQKEWTDALPNLGDTRDELGKIYDLVKDLPSFDNIQPLSITIKNLIDLNTRLAAQSDRVRNAMSTL